MRFLKLHRSKIFFLFLVFTSCLNNGLEIPKAETVFLEEIKEKLSGNINVIFVLNDSGCQPCKDKLEILINKDYLNAKVLIFKPNFLKLSVKNKRVESFDFDEEKLSRFNVLKVNGSVFVIKEKNVMFYKSIIPKDIDNLHKEIVKLYR